MIQESMVADELVEEKRPRRNPKNIPSVRNDENIQGFSMKYKLYDAQEENKGKDASSSLEIIERCATTGTWALISTPDFPSFWHKM